jgi:hypothetical protein
MLLLGGIGGAFQKWIASPKKIFAVEAPWGDSRRKIWLLAT